MDALVKDELVRGLLESSGTEGWTVLLCSHDIGELELLADWVGFLERGTIRMSESMDSVHARFKRVEVTVSSEFPAVLPSAWMSVERAGKRLTFLTSTPAQVPVEQAVAAQLPGTLSVESRDATLREVFVALAKHKDQRAAGAPQEVAA
jgi:ABC-2 type transport system ATP-binding protein